MHNKVHLPVIGLMFIAALDIACRHEATSVAMQYDSRPSELESPTMSVSVGIETGECFLNWTASPGAVYYTLEVSKEPSFVISEVVYSGPLCSYYLGYGPDDAATHYYRVRAESFDARSDWSEMILFPSSDGNIPTTCISAE